MQELFEDALREVDTLHAGIEFDPASLTSDELGSLPSLESDESAPWQALPASAVDAAPVEAPTPAATQVVQPKPSAQTRSKPANATAAPAMAVPIVTKIAIPRPASAGAAQTAESGAAASETGGATRGPSRARARPALPGWLDAGLTAVNRPFAFLSGRTRKMIGLVSFTTLVMLVVAAAAWRLFLRPVNPLDELTRAATESRQKTEPPKP